MTRGVREGPFAWLFLTAGTVAAGAVGWVVDVAILWTLAVGLGWPTSIAAACGVAASAGVNFALNRLVHGGTRGQGRREAGRYGILFVLNVIVTAVSVPVLADLLGRVVADRGLQLLGAKVITTAALLLFNAYAYHRWVFRPPQTTTDPEVR